MLRSVRRLLRAHGFQSVPFYTAEALQNDGNLDRALLYHSRYQSKGRIRHRTAPPPGGFGRNPACHLHRRGRHHHLLATSHTACACPYDLASGVARHDVAPAFRTGISSDCRDEVIQWTDIGTDHVMKHRKNLQPFGAAGWAHRLIPFNLHRVALRASSAALCSIKSEETDQRFGDAGGNVGVVHAKARLNPSILASSKAAQSALRSAKRAT
jgi:hypothetical protein